MKTPKTKLLDYLGSLRFPWLLLVTIILFLVNVFIPDAFPFVDELLLALVAIILSRVKRRPAGSD